MRCSAARRLRQVRRRALRPISAFIKTIRGSDPDAAVYWLARMLDAGEDPLFIARRLVILASEDVGLADRHALPMAMAAQQAVHFVGMPEGFYPLAHAVLYLATAPKSNAVGRAYSALRSKTARRAATTRCRCTCATRPPS